MFAAVVIAIVALLFLFPGVAAVAVGIAMWYWSPEGFRQALLLTLGIASVLAFLAVRKR